RRAGRRPARRSLRARCLRHAGVRGELGVQHAPPARDRTVLVDRAGARYLLAPLRGRVGRPPPAREAAFPHPERRRRSADALAPGRPHDPSQADSRGGRRPHRGPPGDRRGGDRAPAVPRRWAAARPLSAPPARPRESSDPAGSGAQARHGDARRLLDGPGFRPEAGRAALPRGGGRARPRYWDLRSMPIPRQKTKVAILGGGVGAMAAAFCLTEGPNAGRYDITVYQMGWRLGGKGASGRNAALHDRIEEHGLHIWFGFYYNALPMMRRCYEALGDPHDTFENAFTAHDYVVLEEHVDAQWAHFPLDFPRAAGGGIPMPLDYVRKILKWLREHIARTPLFSRNRAEHGEAERPRTREALASLGRPEAPDAARFLDQALELTTGLEHGMVEPHAILSRTLDLLHEAKRW